jgi:transposase InsO family protein
MRLRENEIKTIYIDPDSPWQNVYVESFHGRLRDECLSREVFWTLTAARVVIEDYRNEYNTFSPHSKLGYLSPATFAARRIAASPSLVGLRPSCVGDGHPSTNQLELKSTPED